MRRASIRPFRVISACFISKSVRRPFPILVRRGPGSPRFRFRGPAAPKSARSAITRAKPCLRSTAQAAAFTLLIGHRAKRHTGVIDVDRVGAYDVDEFWEQLLVTPQSGDPRPRSDLYPCRQRGRAGASDLCRGDGAVQRADGRVPRHYAGFRIPASAWPRPRRGKPVVLEVRSDKVPFILEDGKRIGRLIFEPLNALPAQLYGQDIGLYYQAQV